MNLLRQILGKFEPSMAPPETGQNLAVAPDVHASVHDDGLALLDISTGRVFLCNRTGARIWKGLEAGLDADAISQEISREWGVPWQLVRAQTSTFLLEVERRKLVIRKAGRRP
jgi:hypothetical protein